MAMDRILGWFSSSRSDLDEEEEKEKGRGARSSKERELQPLTEGTVTSYGTNGFHEGGGKRGGGGGGKVQDKDDFVIIVSDHEDPQHCSYDVIPGNKLQGISPTSSPVLKTSHDKSTSTTLSKGRGPPVMEWRSRADLPVRMKGLQATTHKGKVYAGGGYTGHTHSEMIVYEYDPNFDLWAELPVSPMRWFGIAEYKGQVVLVGGKDVQAGRGMKMTNRIAVFDDDSSEWLHPYPPMSTARSHPVAFSHTHLLVVAGGRKGVLDFNVEVFDGTRWMSASSLPLPCSPLTSIIHNHNWYLIGEQSVSTLHHISLDSYLSNFLHSHPSSSSSSSSSSTEREMAERGTHLVWEESATPPFTVSRMMSLGRHLVVLPSPSSNEGGGGGGGSGVQVYISRKEEWYLGGSLPHVSSSASSLLLPRGDLLLFGGDVDGLHYSNKVYKVSLSSNSPQRKKTKFTSFK